MTDQPTNFAQGQLKSFIERIERIEAEKAELAADVKEIYSEAKANGFDTKIMRKVVSRRKKTQQEAEEEDAILDLYMSALNGTAALERTTQLDVEDTEADKLQKQVWAMQKANVWAEASFQTKPHTEDEIEAIRAKIRELNNE